MNTWCSVVLSPQTVGPSFREPHTTKGGVDGGRGGCRSGIICFSPFGCEFLSIRAVAPFPAASRRTGRAELPHLMWPAT